MTNRGFIITVVKKTAGKCYKIYAKIFDFNVVTTFPLVDSSDFTCRGHLKM